MSPRIVPARPALAAFSAALALAVAIGLGRFGFTAAYPLMIRDGIVGLRGGTLAQAMHFLGYFAGALAVMRLPSNRIADACAAGIAASVALLAATAFVGDVASVGGVRFLSGVASAVVMVTASTWLFQVAGTAWAPVLYGGAGLGVVAAAESVALLSSYAASARSVWLALAVAGTALSLPPLLALANARKAPRTASVTPPPRPDMGPRLLIAVYAAGGFGYVVSATYLPLLAAKAAGGLNPAHAFSFFGLCAIPSCLIWLKADAVLGTRRAFALNYALQAAGTLLPGASQHPAAIVAASALVGGTFMGVVAMAMAAGRRHAPGLSYNLMAVLTAAYALGQFAGPCMSAGLVGPSGTLDLPLFTAAAVLAAGSASAVLTRRAGLVRASTSGRRTA